MATSVDLAARFAGDRGGAIEFGTALEFDPAAALRRVVKAAKQ